MDSLFTKIDSYNKSYFGFDPIGAVRNIHMWRRYLALLVLASAIGWIALGWESTWNQVSMFFQYLPGILIGQTSLATFSLKVSQYYGIGQHLSTAVIYGICFILLSVYLEKINITKSLNFFLSASLSFMSIGIYEITYNILYSQLQHQAWTFSFTGKQGLNLTVFTGFILIGVISLAYLYTLHYRPHIGKLTLILIGASTLTYILWVFYPFSLTNLTIQTSTGLWTSTHLFPQTMYAVNLTPLAHNGNGVAYYVANNLLHLVNITNKVFVSLTVLSLSMIRRKQK